MELIDYWRLVRRWFALIAGGTFLAAVLSYGVVHLRTRDAMPTYRSTAAVLVHYVLPFGAPYNPTVSPQVETIALKQLVTEPAALAAVARNTHVSLRQITAVTALVDPTITQITVQVDGRTASAAAAFAQGAATYLADLHSKKIQGEAGTLRHILAGQVAAARAKWMTALIHYNLLRLQPVSYATAANNAAQARLQATLDILQQNYQSLSGQYLTLALVPLPAATVERSRNSTVGAPVPSTMNTVLAATILTLFLLIGLAAILDFVGARLRVRAVRARARALRSSGPAWK